MKINDYIYLPTAEECQSCQWQDKCQDGRKCIHDNNLENKGHAHISQRKGVRQMKNGITIKEYSSILEASRSLGIKQASISNAINGYSKTAGGYEWILV